jgi:hypothetical protein
MPNVEQFTNLDQYYNNQQDWGNHQYITLEQLVNNFMYSLDPDSTVVNVDRNRVVYHAKRCVQELYYDIANEVISIEIELNPSLIIPLPHDYVSFVRISWVDDCGRLRPLAIDNSNNLSQAYLQDNDYNYLYDNNGDILQGSHIQNKKSCSIHNISNYHIDHRYTRKSFNTDRSKLFKNGSYRIDKNRGIMQFSSDVDGRIIVLEYISDGLFQRTDSEIRFHKFTEEAVYDYVYFKLIERRKNVSANEKERARRSYFNNLRKAKRRLTPLDYENVRQVMKNQTKWIKD